MIAQRYMPKTLFPYCFRHINRINKYRNRYNLPPTELYRIFFYDAKPFDGDSKKPISGKFFSFKKTPQYKFRNELFKSLKTAKKNCFNALDFLKTAQSFGKFRKNQTKGLISGKIKISDLEDKDLEYPLKQKAVDMKIGLDIATLGL
jgi:uncharacterized LabA/DUF88 family protein